MERLGKDCLKWHWGYKGFNFDTEMVKRKPELKPIRERERSYQGD